MSKYFYIGFVVLFLIYFLLASFTPKDASDLTWAGLGLLLILSWLSLLLGVIFHISAKLKNPKNIKSYSKPNSTIVKENAESIQELNTKFTGLGEDFHFEIETASKYLIYTNIGGFLGGILLLFLLSSLKRISNIYLFIVGIIIIFLYMFIDYIKWQESGIRKIEIEGNSIKVYRGKNKNLTTIPIEKITGIDIFSKLGRRIINIMIGGTILKPISGITLFSGPRIRITDDYFKDTDFDKFVEVLMKIKGSRL